MTEEEWDAVINVHLKGTFAPGTLGRRVLARAGRRRARTERRPHHQHVVAVGHLRQPGPDQLRRRQGRHRRRSRSSPRLELGRYGVTVNAIAPAARTRMTENLGLGG